jgi:hypothetical protein
VSASEASYRRYPDACNAHDVDRLAGFVAHDVQVDGAIQGPDDTSPLDPPAPPPGRR